MLIFFVLPPFVVNTANPVIVYVFLKLFDWSVDELTESYNQTGDVSETICSFFSKFDGGRKKSKMTNQMVRWKYKSNLVCRVVVFSLFSLRSIFC